MTRIPHKVKCALCFCTYLIISIASKKRASVHETSTKRSLTNTKFWNGYRIGDGIAFIADAPGCEQYPDSIVCSYRQKTNSPSDLSALNIVLESFYSKPGVVKASKRSIIVHARLGDGLCAQVDQLCRGSRLGIPDCWNHREDCWYDPGSASKFYAYSKEVYTALIPKLKQLPRYEVVIVADVHHWTRTKDPRKDFKVDEKYIQNLANFFTELGFPVHRRNPDLPDKDFIFLCSATIFIQGGGGFSELVAAVVDKRGGTVLKPGKSV